MPARLQTSRPSPYPLPVLLKTSHGDVRGQMIKLTTQGFLAEFAGLKIQPGDAVGASFEISPPPPFSHKSVTCQGRTIKFYSQGGPMSKISHLVEIHFVNLDLESLEAIADFLRSGSRPGRP